MDAIRQTIRRQYGAAARAARDGAKSTCGCGTACCEPDPISSNLYDEGQAAAVPEQALLASLGCGNPTALAALRPGETVLDLGSGGGIDVILSARRVGSEGKAYGLDMTGEMVALARDNQRRAGVTNVEFLEGEIERIPLPDASVDVVISNCVINLSVDKDRALAEAFRVLKPGGRFAVSDVVATGEMPADVRGSLDHWAGCLAGALEEAQYRASLARAGFERVDIEPTRTIDDHFMSAFIRARKPAAEAAACCAPECCA